MQNSKVVVYLGGSMYSKLNILLFSENWDEKMKMFAFSSNLL